MFTIKTTINGASLLAEAETVSIAHRGSKQYDHAMQLAHVYDLKRPAALYIFSAPERPEGFLNSFRRLVKPRDYVTAIERDDSAGLPVAVIVSDAHDLTLTDLPGTAYQFVYPGDKAYVMNRHGETVECLKK